MQKMKIPMKINKITIIFVILIAWAVFSLIFMAKSYWQNFKNNQLQAAYSQGYNQGHDQAILEVADVAGKCQQEAIPLNLGNDKDGKPVSMEAYIYATKCLQSAQKAEQPASMAEEPKSE